MADGDIPQSEVSALPVTFDDSGVLLDGREPGRSQRVAQYLVRNGFEPTNVTGGMLSWVQAGRPVCTDDGNTGTV